MGKILRFLWFFIKHLYPVVILLVSDPFDIADRWFGMTYKPPQYIFWVLLAVATVASILLSFRTYKKSGQSSLASQMDDEEKGEHRKDIKCKLITWRKQLRALAKKKTIVGDLRTDIEKDSGFYQVLQHCPSLTSSDNNLGTRRLLFKAKLKYMEGLTKKSREYREYERKLRSERKEFNQKM